MPAEGSSPTAGGRRAVTGKSRTIDDYLAALREDQRPAFRLDGRVLVAFGAAANHCAFSPMSASTVEAHRDELAA